jgi:hypothetical protein
MPLPRDRTHEAVDCNFCTLCVTRSYDEQMCLLGTVFSRATVGMMPSTCLVHVLQGKQAQMLKQTTKLHKATALLRDDHHRHSAPDNRFRCAWESTISPTQKTQDSRTITNAAATMSKVSMIMVLGWCVLHAMVVYVKRRAPATSTGCGNVPATRSARA